MIYDEPEILDIKICSVFDQKDKSVTNHTFIQCDKTQLWSSNFKINLSAVS